MFKVVGAYVIFTSLATGLLLATLAHPRALPAIVLLLGTPAGWLRARRIRQARLVGLTFEDELPTDVTPLRLNAD